MYELTAFTRAADISSYHIFYMKKRCAFSDGIHCLPDFQPRFLQPPCTEQEDLDPFRNVVRGQLLVGGEARSEGFAEKRRSDKPELGSTASMAQQAGRATYTKRAARSSGKM